MRGRRNEFEAFVRRAVKQGANALMRQRGFKRPGGGWTFYRAVGGADAVALMQELEVSATWRRGEEVGALTLHRRVLLRALGSVQAPEHGFPVDVDGDAGDLAVSIHHWLREEGLPWFDAPLDFEALARDAELNHRGFQHRDAMNRCAAIWALAGRPDEVARVQGLIAPEEEPPF